MSNANLRCDCQIDRLIGIASWGEETDAFVLHQSKTKVLSFKQYRIHLSQLEEICLYKLGF